MYKKMITAVGFLAAATLSVPAFAEDAVIADPDHYVVEFENDKVRIIRIKYGPGEKSVMHTHGANASVFITPATVRMTTPDGNSVNVTAQPGDVEWADAEEHLPENLGVAPLEVVLVELKE